MPTTIRLSRGGTKKVPYYRIVVTDSRKPRDSGYIERVGTYNPLLPKGDDKRVKLDAEKIKTWLSKGAQTSEAVARFLRAAGLLTAKPTFVAKPKGSNLKKKAQAAIDAAKAKEEEARAAAEAEKAAAEAPKEEAPAAEEAAPAEAAAEEKPAE